MSSEWQEIVSLKDRLTQEECVVIVRIVQQDIVFGLSRESDGDVEVVINGSDCERMIGLLRRALVALQSKT